MRYPEIDFARGIAVILMITFHIFFDAYYFGKIELSGAFWYYFPRFIGGMFIFISGITLTVVKPDFRRVLRKVLRLSALAAGITVVTYVSVPKEYVIFGILHFFSLATVMGFIFIGHPRIQLLAGVAAFIAGLFIHTLRADTNIFLWLGLIPKNFATLDYYPILPWFGVFLLGMYAGNYFRSTDIPWPKSITKIGRNSLKIYILQHPVIILILHLLYGDVLQQILHFY